MVEEIQTADLRIIVLLTLVMFIVATLIPVTREWTHRPTVCVQVALEVEIHRQIQIPVGCSPALRLIIILLLVMEAIVQDLQDMTTHMRSTIWWSKTCIFFTNTIVHKLHHVYTKDLGRLRLH